MSVHLKRIVFFFCIWNFGLGCCLGNRVNADDPLNFMLYLSGVYNKYDIADYSHKISGFVFLVNGNPLENVGIYLNAIENPFTSTNSQGYYDFYVDNSESATVTPKMYGYQFDPPSFLFPTAKDNQKKDFTAFKHIISGTVKEQGTGKPLENVGIYDGKKLLALTNIDGYYETEENAGIDFTLTAQLPGYEFPTSGIPIIGSGYLHENKDFTATKLAPPVTISGNVTWKNISDVTTIQSNPLPGDNNLTIPAIAIAMEACPQDGSPCSRIVADVDGKYSISVPFNWSGSVKPFSLGFEFNPEKITYSALKVNKTLQNYQAPLSPNGSVYKITVLVKDQNGNLLPYDPRISIILNGTNHAKGSRYQYFTVPVRPKWPFSATEWAFSSIPSGWIGDITTSSADYTFTPSSIRLEGIVTGDRVFTFTATPLKPIVFSGTIIWMYAQDLGKTLPAVNINAVARDGAPFSYEVVTGADGKYSIPLPYNWSGSFTPSSPGFSFDPATTTVSGLTVDWVQNFWVWD
jgi:hypothetical protein